MKMNVQNGKDPLDVQPTLDDLAHTLRQDGTILPESMILQCVSEALPEECHLENQMKIGEPLERDMFVTETLACYLSLQDSLTISEEVLVVKEHKPKASKESPGVYKKDKSKIVCLQCDRPGRVQSKPPWN